MSRYDYLLAGPEYDVFSRPKEGLEIEKQMKELAQPSYQDLVKNYMLLLNVKEDQIRDFSTQAHRTESDFLFGQYEEFLKKLRIHLKALKKQIKSLIDTTQMKQDLDKQLIAVLSKFEERTNAFADGQQKAQQHIQSNVLTADIVRAGHQLGIGNPFLPLLYFVKGEEKDIKAMHDSMASRANLIAEIKRIATRRVTVTQELEDKI